MNNDHMYMKVLRVGAGAGAFTLWLVSIQFSVAGFSITLPELAWIGWALAGTVTILQLIFNKGVYSNPTLFAAGILAYVYGITTNIMGIMRAQEILDNLINNFTADLGYYVPRTVMAIVLALVIEIVPEALFLWAIFLDKANVGDFVTSIIRGTNLSQKKSKSVQKGVQGRVQGQDRTKSDGFVPSVPSGTEFVQTRTVSGQSQDNDVKTVLSYANAHKRKHGSLPAVRKVEHDTGVPKTKVAEILQPIRGKWDT